MITHSFIHFSQEAWHVLALTELCFPLLSAQLEQPFEIRPSSLYDEGSLTTPPASPSAASIRPPPSLSQRATQATIEHHHPPPYDSHSITLITNDKNSALYSPTHEEDDDVTDAKRMINDFRDLEKW